MTTASGEGKFSSSVTLLVYVPTSQTPYNAKQETSGTVAPSLQIAPGIFSFNVKVLTSPYASEPPPDGGVTLPG